MSKKWVETKEKKTVFNGGIFTVEEAIIRYQGENDSEPHEVKRLSFERGDSVGVLIHETDTQQLVFAEQFRYSTYQHGHGWLLEIVAGVVEENEDPKAAMIREVSEEVGYRLNGDTMELISHMYLSPGASSERMWIYYAPVVAADKVDRGGGLAAEQEFVATIKLSVDECFAKLAAGEWIDAKTILSLQWFKAQSKG